MGVAGSGKSTLGAALAARLGARFLEADDFHSPANVAKMASGVPLDDADRWPWLAALRQAMRDEQQVVLACSALRRRTATRSGAPATSASSTSSSTAPRSNSASPRGPSTS